MPAGSSLDFLNILYASETKLLLVEESFNLEVASRYVDSLFQKSSQVGDSLEFGRKPPITY